MVSTFETKCTSTRHAHTLILRWDLSFKHKWMNWIDSFGNISAYEIKPHFDALLCCFQRNVFTIYSLMYWLQNVVFVGVQTAIGSNKVKTESTHSISKFKMPFPLRRKRIFSPLFLLFIFLFPRENAFQRFPFNIRPVSHNVVFPVIICVPLHLIIYRFSLSPWRISNRLHFMSHA